MIFEEQMRFASIKRVAEQMLVAANTAPKTRGLDSLVYAYIEGDEIKRLAEKMQEISVREDFASFARDAGNILASPIVVFIGTKIQPKGLKICGLCGFANCAEKNKYPSTPCTFNTADLGIAVGSAVSIAMDNRVDNRVMYTVGFAALELGLLPKEVKIACGIPLSASGKNIFFDRPQNK
jgi:uncharacterized ferredoxin-like protein